MPNRFDLVLTGIPFAGTEIDLDILMDQLVLILINDVKLIIGSIAPYKWRFISSDPRC